ncbi:Fic family protein [Peptoniphilus stercorisuis]|uniref:Fic family protein n=1 Tax=Peptoniphilus stercorisuis TaxID=1436965 RepID=A0ABS4KHW8_9FIRM|nr:Fic family protein [Peptoniphilus stercorisuis]MBP2026209.1 Fic family protein [Peptoniphilus stercorisuis]
MQYMNKLFYNLRGYDEKKRKLEERLKYDSIISPNLKIKPINQSKIYELYYIPTMKTIDLINSISKDDIILVDLYNELPDVAKKAFLIDMLSSELFSTNEIEGVKSSKEELVSTTKEVLKSENYNTNLRFSNIINSYFQLQMNNLKRPKDFKDIRKIYDEITIDGVSEEDLPDGEYFRKNLVYIHKQGKEIHRGVSQGDNTEEYIILVLEQLLDFLNTDEKCNSLIKNAIFHYYFGYIHPFYDGNGRTNRFISSIYLKEDYSWLTALSLSQGCNEYRNLYLKAFDMTNQVSMQGELNFFVDSFLEILNNGQNILKDNISNKMILLELAYKKSENDKNINEDKLLLNITKVAIELSLFGLNDYIDIDLLKEVLGYSEQTLRIKLNKLVELNILEKISKNPIKCILNNAYLEEKFI